MGLHGLRGVRLLRDLGLPPCPDTHGHFVAKDKKEACALAVRAGVNIELPEPDCYLHLVELVKKGVLRGIGTRRVRLRLCCTSRSSAVNAAVNGQSIASARAISAARAEKWRRAKLASSSPPITSTITCKIKTVFIHEPGQRREKSCSNVAEEDRVAGHAEKSRSHVASGAYAIRAVVQQVMAQLQIIHDIVIARTREPDKKQSEEQARSRPLHPSARPGQ